MIFAQSEREITLIYNSNDHIGKQALAYAKAEGLPVRDIDVMHTKVTSTQWAEIANRLDLQPHDLINTEHPNFQQKFPGEHDMDEHTWLSVLVHNPETMRAPIAMKGDRILLLEDPQDLVHFH